MSLKALSNIIQDLPAASFIEETGLLKFEVVRLEQFCLQSMLLQTCKLAFLSHDSLSRRHLPEFDALCLKWSAGE